ncbi:hypothetical protein R1sor_000569 [Riccia sorocarpa]|uniref:Uncharacterized protein n=1 Tax=Riccia sorocarpa TaxID=122646 RepID=A0ABD3GTG7_9MARC
MKAMKTRSWLDTASAIPLIAILSFSIFMVWQWVTEPPYTPAISNFQERANTFPLDQVAALTSIALPATNSDTAASNRVLPGADEKIDEFEYFVHQEEETSCCKCAFAERESEKSQRVAPLLHGWNDSELIKRAVDLDEGATDRYSASLDCLQSEASTFNNPETKLPKDRKNESSRVPCTSCIRPKAKVKIAFMFMITTSLPFEALWNEYFRGHEGMFNVYVHADPLNVTLFPNPSSVFHGRLIPSAHADRGSPSLVMASQRLMANAMIDDPLNQYFALLSGSCIPIRSFDYGYKLITSSNQSFIEQITNETVMVERYSGREGGGEIMLPEIPFEKFRKGAQWFVFIRRHALLVLKDQLENKYWDKFNRPCVVYFCGTDEHYYHTLINILDSEGANGKCVTYVTWPPYISEHPVEYGNWQIKKELIEDMQKQDDGQYLFARKFDADTADSLMALTDTILH